LAAFKRDMASGPDFYGMTTEQTMSGDGLECVTSTGNDDQPMTVIASSVKVSCPLA
jgi:hypothetical protein